jgi:hypothetical protein
MKGIRDQGGLLRAEAPNDILAIARTLGESGPCTSDNAVQSPTSADIFTGTA